MRHDEDIPVEPSARERARKAIRKAPSCGDVVNRPCCGGRDLGPIDEDEGPSQADVERFGDVTTKCPECGTELYDEAAVCWKCGHAIGDPAFKPMSRWTIVAIGLVVLAAIGLILTL
jgi:hypothetical protein